jgi:hypothetical protein
MKKENLSLIINPFEKITRLPALGWGVAGLMLFLFF